MSLSLSSVDSAKDNYDDYKDEVKKQESLFAKVKQDYKNKTGYIELADVEEFEELLDDLKEDDSYYKANIALATITVATKTTALLAQGAKAASSSGTYGFNAGLELDIDAIEKQLKEYEERSIASNLDAQNINLDANNKATIQGSNLNAKEDININASQTDILASQDIANQDSSSEHKNINLSIDVYGGPSASVSSDSSKSSSEQTKYTNSNLQANNININTKETTTIKGANLKAQDTLTLNSKNLEVESVQDKSKSKSHGEGMSAGFGSTGLTSLGMNSSDANSNSKQTVLTSLTGNKVDITTQQETKLRGATIAALDADGNDNSNLNLKTKTLLASSLNNRINSKSTSLGINLGGAVEKAKITNVGIDYSNDKTNSKTKTLATLGSGNIQIGNQEDSETRMLNRDASNNEVDIYNISSHKGLKGELDTRLLTESGRAEIANDAKKTGKEMQKLDKILPSGTNDNAVLAAAGKTLNFLNTVSLGIVPSDDSDGGIIAQIPVLVGQHDIYQKVIKVASLGSQYVQENLDDFIKVQDSDYYKNASQAVRDTLDGTPDLYVSKEPIKIDITTASYQNFTNGMMNNEAEAIKNGISQTHAKGDEKVNLTVNYNPTHGLLGDALESAVDKFGGTTGMAEQTGEFIRDVTTARGTSGSNFAAHSQGNILTYSGVNFIKAKGDFENGGFKDRDYFMNYEL
jgi:outer membrane lipopolysaccharide assembly protein LptE/RlpB